MLSERDETPHDTDSEECWCAPEVLQICPICDGSDKGCQHCNWRGLVPQYNDELPCIIVHRTIEEIIEVEKL